METVTGMLRFFSRKPEVLHKINQLVHPRFCFYSPIARRLKQAAYSERSYKMFQLHVNGLMHNANAMVQRSNKEQNGMLSPFF
jgi:hypothetical protein